MSTENITTWRRACGCMRTSEKLKQILKVFPEPPPPTPSNALTPALGNNTIITPCEYQSDARPMQAYQIPALFVNDLTHFQKFNREKDVEKEKVVQQPTSKSWQLVTELISLLQLSVTATALALYYLIYCYMQLIYFTLRSAVYFHQADGPMKITIAVMTITSILVGFQVIMRIEKIIGITT